MLNEKLVLPLLQGDVLEPKLVGGVPCSLAAPTDPPRHRFRAVARCWVAGCPWSATRRGMEALITSTAPPTSLPPNAAAPVHAPAGSGLRRCKPPHWSWSARRRRPSSSMSSC